jgi:hypothetical protein
VKIYYCWSKIKDASNIKLVNVLWFRYDRRTHPISPYSEIIYDYYKLDNGTRKLMREFADEHLTLDEAVALTRYLQELYNISVELEATETPLKFMIDIEVGRRTTPVRYYTKGLNLKNPNINLIRLSKEPGYSLPFEVWGYYNTEFKTKYIDLKSTGK